MAQAYAARRSATPLMIRSACLAVLMGVVCISSADEVPLLHAQRSAALSDVDVPPPVSVTRLHTIRTFCRVINTCPMPDYSDDVCRDVGVCALQAPQAHAWWQNVTVHAKGRSYTVQIFPGDDVR
jgi:hypothetical protein